MTPLKLTRHQETVRFTEVGCSAPEIRLSSAQDALQIKVDSGPKQSFQIKKIDGGDHILADTPLIPAGESYLWEPTTKGTYLIKSTIYDGLATTITVGLSLTPPQNGSNNKSNIITSSRGHASAVDDCLRLPLASKSSRSSLLGVSTSSTTTTVSPLSSSSYGTPGSISAASSLSTPNSSGGAAFRLPGTSRSSATHSSSGGVIRGSLDTATSSSTSSPDTSLPPLRHRDQRSLEDDEEHTPEEVTKHPSMGGMRRRTVGTDTSKQFLDQQQQQGEDVLWRSIGTAPMMNSSTSTTTSTNTGGTTTRPRRQLIAVNQPYRRSMTPDIEEESSSPLQPCSPLAGPNTINKYNTSSSNKSTTGSIHGGGSNNIFSTFDETVKYVDLGRSYNGLINTSSNSTIGSGVGTSSGVNSSFHSRNRAEPPPEIQIISCPRCKKDYACLSNQQRCMASHIKRGKQARHPPRASPQQLITFWDGLDKEERLDIADLSSIPEATNAFYDLFAWLEGSEKSRSTYSFYNSASSAGAGSAAGSAVLQLEKAGKELTQTLKSSDKIHELTGEDFLKILEAATEGTLLFGSPTTTAAGGGGGSGSDSAVFSSSSPLSASSFYFLECTVMLGSVIGTRLISALKAEQKRKAELAYSELEAALVAEEKAEEKKKKKSNKKKNKKKASAAASVGRPTSNAGDDDDETDETHEVAKEEESITTTTAAAAAAAAVLVEEIEIEEEDTAPVQLHQRPTFDSCLEETEVVVINDSDGDDRAVVVSIETEILENKSIQIEDSAADEVCATVVVVIDESPGEATEDTENNFIVDFGDDTSQQQEEEREQKAATTTKTAIAAAAVKKHEESAGGVSNNIDGDGLVIVKKIEKIGTTAKVKVVAPEPQQFQQQQQQQQESGDAFKLNRSAKRRLERKAKEQAKLAAAEPVPGEPPQSGVATTVASTKASTSDSGTSTGAATAAATATAANLSQRQPIPVPISVQKQNEQQVGKQNNKKKNQQQQQQSVVDVEASRKSEAPPQSEAAMINQETEKKVDNNNTNQRNNLETEAPMVETDVPTVLPAAPAAPGYYNGGGGGAGSYSRGGPSYPQMPYYHPPPPPHMEPYNPHMYMHAYPIPQQMPPSESIPTGHVEDEASAGGAGSVLPPPPPPPGVVSSSSPVSAAGGGGGAPYGRGYPYMMPHPPHLPPGMMHLPLHPMAMPVYGTPAAGAAGAAGPLPLPVPLPPVNLGGYPSSLSSPLADGVALGIPVNYDQQPSVIPQQQEEQQQEQLLPEQEKEKEEEVVVAVKENSKSEVKKDEDRFKKMLWDAQLRSVNGDVSLLRKLTAQLNEASTPCSSASSQSGGHQISAEEPAARATFDMEAAKRYFEKKSKELIGEDKSISTAGVDTVEQEEKQVVVSAAEPAPAPVPAPAAPVQVAMAPPKNPYLRALAGIVNSTPHSESPSNSTVVSENSNIIDHHDGQQKKKKVRGSRNRQHHHPTAAAAADAGVDKTVSEPNRPPPPLSAAASCGGAAGQKRFPPPSSASRQNASNRDYHSNNGNNTQYGPRRRNNNNNNHNNTNSSLNNKNNTTTNNAGSGGGGGGSSEYLGHQQRPQQPSSFLAAVSRGAAQDDSVSL